LYFNTTDGVMKVYTASGWLAASSASVATLATFEFVATAAQTVFTGNDANGASLSYVAPALIVTLNGVRLRPGDDYTATNGTSITLVSAAAAGDELVVDAFGAFLIANTYSIAQADTLLAAKAADNAVVKLTGNQSIAGNKNFAGNTLYVDDTNDKVGVGTTTTTNKFNVAGAIQSSSTLVAIEPNTVAISQESGFARVAAFGADASTPGVLDLMVISTNGGVQRGMRIDSAGRVITPYQPAFYAYRSGDGNVGGDQDLSCNVADVNIGGHYNTSNFRFTAPVAGTYSFTFHAMNNQTNPGSSTIFIQKNGVNYHYFHIVNSHPSSSSSTVIMTLAVGDYISCHGSNFHWNGGSQNKYPTFCGHLLG